MKKHKNRRMIVGGLTACLLATGYFALSVASATSADARSWSRGGSFVGPRGTTTWQRSGSCSGGVCARSGSVTGPGGRSATRAGSVTRNGNSWDRNVSATGRNGGTWSRDGGGSCSGGRCTYGGTVTGPNGNSRTYHGSFGRLP